MMDGLTAGRPDGRLRRIVIAATSLFLAVGPSGPQAAAQVGHEPGNSPYRDIPLGSGPMVFVGHLGGGRGALGVGTSNAFTLGARYELPAGRALQFQFSTALLRGDRYIIDPRADSTSAARKTGPFKSELGLFDIGMQLRLTGGKTWHGISPYVGTGLGVLFDVNSPGDSTGSGYSFGTKIGLTLSSGVRWYPARRIILTADLRGEFWRLKYPVSFHTVLAPDGSRVLDLSKPLGAWTAHPWLSLGVGWTF